MKQPIARRQIVDRLVEEMRSMGIENASTRRGKTEGTFHTDGKDFVGRGRVDPSPMPLAELGAGFPTRKSLEEFNFDHQPTLGRDVIAHLGTGGFLTKAHNVVLLGPPGTGKTHLAIGLAIKAAHAGHRVAFATAVDWVARLKAAHAAGKLAGELVKLRRIGLIVVDEVGYIPFEQDAANLFFQLVSSRYEHASLILTSNLPFARWGDVFGDQVVAAAMIDRIVHHAEVLT